MRCAAPPHWRRRCSLPGKSPRPAREVAAGWLCVGRQWNNAAPGSTGPSGITGAACGRQGSWGSSGLPGLSWKLYGRPALSWPKSRESQCKSHLGDIRIPCTLLVPGMQELRGSRPADLRIALQPHRIQAGIRDAQAKPGGNNEEHPSRVTWWFARGRTDGFWPNSKPGDWSDGPWTRRGAVRLERQEQRRYLRPHGQAGWPGTGRRLGPPWLQTRPRNGLRRWPRRDAGRHVPARCAAGSQPAAEVARSRRRAHPIGSPARPCLS